MKETASKTSDEVQHQPTGKDALREPEEVTDNGQNRKFKIIEQPPANLNKLILKKKENDSTSKKLIDKRRDLYEEGQIMSGDIEMGFQKGSGFENRQEGMNK